MLKSFDWKSGQWRPTLDQVMGGRSTAQFQQTCDGTILFTGFLSLENRGGFAGMRSHNAQLNLSSAVQAIEITVRGDGRQYNLNLYQGNMAQWFYFQHKFSTVKDQWV